VIRMDKQLIVALINLGAIAVPLGAIKRDMRKAEKTIGNTEILHVPATPNPYHVQPNEDGEYVYCDFCGLPVDSLDGVTDGFAVGCGNFRGNGCGEKHINESEEK